MLCNRKILKEVLDERVEDPKQHLLLKETELRANRALEMYESIDPKWEFYDDEINRQRKPEKRRMDNSAVLHDLKEPHVVIRKKNHELDFVKKLARVSQSKFQTSQHYPFAAISIFYGAFHLAAWNAFFSSLVEKWMWRTVAIAIVALPPTYLIWRSLFSNKGLLLRSEKTLKTILTWIWLAVGAAFVFIVGTCFAVGYVYGRLYIFGEVFANLREVPADTYITVEWTNFIPHAG